MPKKKLKLKKQAKKQTNEMGKQKKRASDDPLSRDIGMRMAHQIFTDAQRDRSNGKSVPPELYELAFEVLVEPWLSQVNDAMERYLQALARERAITRARLFRTFAETGKKEERPPKDMPMQIRCRDCKNQGTLEGGEFDEDLGIVCWDCGSIDVHMQLDSQMRTCLERGPVVLNIESSIVF